MCREELQGGRWQVASGRWRLAGGNWQVANGKRQPAVRSRPHNHRFDLWQHFCSQLLRTHQAQNKKNRARNGNHMECACFPAPAITTAAADLVQIPCPARVCVPAKLPSSPTKVAPVAVVIAVPRRGTFNCRSNATFCSVHELKLTRFHQFQVELVPQFGNIASGRGGVNGKGISRRLVFIRSSK